MRSRSSVQSSRMTLPIKKMRPGCGRDILCSGGKAGRGDRGDGT